MIQKAMAPLALATALALCAALSGCGHSDSAADAASSDSVEMPAEQALSGIVATPAADASAAATDASAHVGADLVPMPASTAAAPAPPATGPAAAASSGVDKD